MLNNPRKYQRKLSQVLWTIYLFVENVSSFIPKISPRRRDKLRPVGGALAWWADQFDGGKMVSVLQSLSSGSGLVAVTFGDAVAENALNGAPVEQTHHAGLDSLNLQFAEEEAVGLSLLGE